MTRCYIGGQSCSSEFNYFSLLSSYGCSTLAVCEFEIMVNIVSDLVEDNPKRSSMMCFVSTIKASEF
jgi:hypothetical protein